jgi:hypothetical protein
MEYEEKTLKIKKYLEGVAEANWKSNIAPQDFENFETYKKFLVDSYEVFLATYLHALIGDLINPQ